MTDTAAMIEKARNAADAIGADLAVFGGLLRCPECGTEQPLGDVGHHLGHGWPECCGQTMAWVTPRLLAFEARQPVPAGFHLVAVADHFDSHGRMRADTTRRCRRLLNRRSCGKPSVMAVLRGTMRPTWWGYCADHAFGRWIEDGQVMCWILKADDDG